MSWRIIDSEVCVICDPYDLFPIMSIYFTEHEKYHNLYLFCTEKKTQKIALQIFNYPLVLHLVLRIRDGEQVELSCPE